MATKREKATVSEPRRKSILDNLLENFKLANRVTYVHRLIYIGEHHFSASSAKNINEVFESIIKRVNDYCHDEKLTGYLLHYDRYFCHVIEGSENSLNQHLELMIKNENVNNNFGRLKLLTMYHHVNQRILDEWISVTAKPPTLLEKIDTTTDLKYSMEKIKHCINKLCHLGMSLRFMDIIAPKNDDQNADEAQGEIENYKHDNVTYDRQTEPISNCLPEFSIIEFLLDSPHIQDLREYFRQRNEIPYMKSYRDLVWPIPSDFVPMNIFDDEIDPVTNLP